MNKIITIAIIYFHNYTKLSQTLILQSIRLSYLTWLPTATDVAGTVAVRVDVLVAEVVTVAFWPSIDNHAHKPTSTGHGPVSAGGVRSSMGPSKVRAT